MIAKFPFSLGWAMMLLIAPPLRAGSAESRPLAPPSSEGTAQLTLIADTQLGLAFQGQSRAPEHPYTFFLPHAGLASGDLNGDHLPDLVLGSADGRIEIRLNQGGWKFRSATKESGLKWTGHLPSGLSLADVEGDGDLDLLILSVQGPQQLWLNDGKASFTLSEQKWLSHPDGGPVTAAWADVDLDGDLDLYLTRYRSVLTQDRIGLVEADRRVDEGVQAHLKGLPPSAWFQEHFTIVTNGVGASMEISAEENGIPDVLYLNDGKGNLSPAPANSFQDAQGHPMALPADWGITATFRDVDQDGDPDLYICNDFWTPDRFWINDGQGHFSPSPSLMLRRTSSSSMGVDFGDFNLDGHWDFAVVDMLSQDHARRKRQMGAMKPPTSDLGKISDRPQIMQNTLFLNRGDNTFAEIAQMAGVKASEWSWSPVFWDADMDGWMDLFISTGMNRDYTDADAIQAFGGRDNLSYEDRLKQTSTLPRLDTRNILFRNKGNLRFEDIGESWGITVGGVSGAVTLADFDLDGDLDLVANNLDTSPEFYRVDSQAPRISLEVHMPGANPMGIGTQVRLLDGDKLLGMHELVAGGIYSASRSTTISLPTGAASRVRAEVRWPGGQTDSFTGLKPGFHYTLSPSGNSRPSKPASKTHQRFEDWTARLNHQHQETDFNDFERQSLLPNRLSRLGPAVLVADLDQDDRDDIALGTGAGGSWTALRNTHQGWAPYTMPSMRIDQAGMAAFKDARGIHVLGGLSNFEAADAPIPAFQEFVLDDKGWNLGVSGPVRTSTTGPLCLGDVDGDGDLDLFVGGRTVPGRYPEAADSLLMLQEKGQWVPHPASEDLFKSLGLVSAATLGDLNGDGRADLAVALEWGPVRVWLSSADGFQEITESSGLQAYPGWWNGVALGDFNGDGALDLVASNWGRNSKYEHAYSLLKPLRVYFNDFDNNGVLDIVEAHVDKKLGKWVPERGFSCSSRAMPFIRTKLQTYANFGGSDLFGIYGEGLNQAQTVEANTLDHMIFLNRGNRFEAMPLPLWSQLAPGFGLSVADFDGDGHEDLFMAQNYFAVQVETPRNDGGRGLLLLGLGDGTFDPVQGQNSGILVYGDQRGTAVGDFDGDHRPDLIVTQNAGPTRMFRNIAGKPGLRVELQGPDSNRWGIGARLRLATTQGMGPTRVLTSGGGYWSQSSPRTLLGMPAEPIALEVQWPGGLHQIVPIKPGTTSLKVKHPGLSVR